MDFKDRIRKTLNEQTGNDGFVNTKTKVDLTGGPTEQGIYVDEYDKEVAVAYNIDVDYRDWGIKTISVIPVGNATINVRLVDANDNEKQFTLNVDLSQLKEEIIEGHGAYVDELDIWIKDDLSIDYDSSTIRVVR